MKNTRKMHKLMSILVCCALLLGMFPANVFAQTADGSAVLIPFEKVWDDNSDEQGFRPEEISVSLYKYSGDTFDADTAALVETKSVTQSDGWACDFSVSTEDVYDSEGNTYSFKVVEGEVAAYEEAAHTDPVVTATPFAISDEWQRITPCSELQYDSTGEYRLTVLAKKGSTYVIWTLDALSESERQALFDSAKAGVNGFGGGSYSSATFISGVGSTSAGITVTDSTIVFENSSSWSFFATGAYIPAAVEATGASITNKYVPQTTTISGSKTWDDAGNQDGKRPQSITINLMNGETVVDTKVVTANDNWSWTFADVAKYENGKEIQYSISEEAVEGYKASYDGYDVTNSHTPEKITISGEKTWDDAKNQDGKRPESITVKLMKGEAAVATKTVTAEDDWKWSFENVDKYENGKVIEYSISETAVDGYKTTYNGYDVTNSHTPETVTISGAKTWDDAGNQDGIRPQSITISLMKGEAVVATKTVTAENGWKWSFKDVAKYENGKVIEYSISEEAVEGYKASYDGYDVTNSHTPEKITISGSKTWNDAKNQDGKRPQSITISLMKGEAVVATKTVTAEDDWKWSFVADKYQNGTAIEYSIKEEAVEGYKTTYNGYNVTNSYTPEKISISGAKTWDDGENQDGIRPESITVSLKKGNDVVATKTVTAEDEWKYTFENLDKYENGEEIRYRVVEDNVEDYAVIYDGFNIKNSHTPRTLTISGEKIWDDAENQDGKRPQSITIKLMQGANLVDTAVVTAEDDWKYTFENVAKFNKGEELQYRIVEETVEGYVATYDGYNVKNSYTPETVTVSGEKTWDDADNQDGKRPQSITINLMNGETVVDTRVVTAEDDWKWSFDDVAKYENGTLIEYSIAEETVDGYETTYDGFNITNSYTPETVTISGEKTWDDARNQDGKRPQSITIKLMQGETVVETKVVTAEDDWKYTFENVAKFDKGEELQYRIVEEAVEGYVATYDGYNVTNSHTPEKITIEGLKTWNDADNQDGIRPEEITINLTKGEEIVDTKVVTAEDGWKYSFEGLDKYENGEEIEYGIFEDEIEGYETAYDGFNITNTHIPEVTVISGTKTWDDDNNRDGLRPKKITVSLMKGETVVDTQVVKEKDDWTYTFEDVARYENGEEIQYRVVEKAVEGYVATYDGFNIKNSHTPETVKISITKLWDDEDNKNSKRPASITVSLMKGDKAVETKVVTEKDKWTYTFKEVAKYENGKEIAYTVSEKAVNGYVAAISGNTKDGFIVINSLIVEKPTTPDVPSDTPNTGDTSNMFLWIAVLMVAVMFVTADAIYRRKKASSEQCATE